MKITKAEAPKKRIRLPGKSAEDRLSGACQTMFDELSEVLPPAVALARVVGHVFFAWATTIVDPRNREAMAPFDDEMSRLMDKARIRFEELDEETPDEIQLERDLDRFLEDKDRE